MISGATPVQLPPVLAGPVLRRVDRQGMALWLVTRDKVAIEFRLYADGDTTAPRANRTLTDGEVTRLRIGTHAWVHLLNIRLEQGTPENTWLEYDLGVSPHGGDASTITWIQDWAPHLCAEGTTRPRFVFKRHLDRILHGSCRRPHHPSADGLARVDAELTAADTVEAYPAVLLMTGDQIYADDVAGPMLLAIRDVIQRLGLFQESLEGASLTKSAELMAANNTLYRRHELLPESEFNEQLSEKFFGGVRKPIFTTANAENHLISFAEVMAMYLLVWSPVPWNWVTDTEPDCDKKHRERFQRDAGTLAGFRRQLPRAARALARIPVYMIFDDHDVTDDWNLSALWETTAYQHPFSCRIIGNALLGYLLCQGWGNQPQQFDELLSESQALFNTGTEEQLLDHQQQDALINQLLHFRHWHYSLNTVPKLVVLDTRTHRWRSEVRRGHPSGLMDWESLTDFQQEVMGEDAVVVVSAAPMFGVKLIESIQRVFTWFGKPLLVDAENWMAHRGAANVLLNIFGHPRTPRHFVILSGDVHYSFAYDVTLRHKANSPTIWQINSSGIKNQFPHQLLEWLDRLNRWLFAPWSPLNWFTKRRRMRIAPRRPEGREAGERLWNCSGIGDVRLNTEGAPVAIRQLNSDGGGTEFHDHTP